MSKHLRSCVQCARHIRITETTCPFCSAVVPDDRKAPPLLGTPAGRLGRAFAVSSLAAAGSLGAAHCSSETAPVITGVDAYGSVEMPDTGPSVGDVMNAAEADGAVEPQDSGADAPPVITGVDAYGAPSFLDTGSPETDGSAESDAPNPPDSSRDGVSTAEAGEQ